MPFIEEEKFSLMQQDLDNANLKREELENELEQANEDKSKLKRVSIFIGALLGLAIAAAGYFYSNGSSTGNSSLSSNVNIEEIKANAIQQAIDSINAIQSSVDGNTDQYNDDSNNLGADNVESTVSNLNNNTQGETIYSVQIGVFANRRYPLISEKFIPGNLTPPSNGYFKQSIGIYATLNEAKKLRNELRKLGFDDAFVASYVNGKRQKIHH